MARMQTYVELWFREHLGKEFAVLVDDLNREENAVRNGSFASHVESFMALGTFNDYANRRLQEFKALIYQRRPVLI